MKETAKGIEDTVAVRSPHSLALRDPGVGASTLPPNLELKTYLSAVRLATRPSGDTGNWRMGATQASQVCSTASW